MFGIAKPCRHTLPPALHREWMAHLCGLCLTLRDHHGQAARATTNTDAVVLSILTGAQRRVPLQTTMASPCALRGMRPARVVTSGEGATVHAAAVSLTMAATKVADHALDHDGLAGRAPRLAGSVSRRWAEQGDDLAGLVGFDTAPLLDAVARSNDLELAARTTATEPATAVITAGPTSSRRGPADRAASTGPGPDRSWFAVCAAPTEDAAASAFGHTAVLADRPEHHDALDRLGRAYGRIVYLLDAYTDAEDDLAADRFNALVLDCPSPAARHDRANDLFRVAYAELVEAFEELDLHDGALARAVLVDQIKRVGHQTLHVSHASACRTHTAAHTHAADRAPASQPGPGAAMARAGHAVRRAPRQLAHSGHALGQLALAGLAAVGFTAAIFRPENPGEPPFDPSQGVPPQYPPQQYPPGQVPPGQPPAEQAQSHLADAADTASDCFCDGCACCCCDSCCDSCDCCDCCDC